MAKRIVIINNDTSFLDLMETLLSEEGYDTHIIRESKRAYPGARELDPDAIILDIRMESPEAGWQILELIKLDPILTKKPVVICSADVQALRERSDYLKSKGCEILPKPFDLEDLLDVISRLIGSPQKGSGEA